MKDAEFEETLSDLEGTAWNALQQHKSLKEIRDKLSVSFLRVI